MNNQSKDIDEVVGHPKFIDSMLEKIMMLAASSNEVNSYKLIP